MKINLELNNEEIKLMRNCTSDLSCENKDAVSLLLKIANAIIDAQWHESLNRNELPYPGEGYRLLNLGEETNKNDEYFSSQTWKVWGDAPKHAVTESTLPVRRKFNWFAV